MYWVHEIRFLVIKPNMIIATMLFSKHHKIWWNHGCSDHIWGPQARLPGASITHNLILFRMNLPRRFTIILSIVFKHGLIVKWNLEMLLQEWALRFFVTIRIGLCRTFSNARFSCSFLTWVLRPLLMKMLVNGRAPSPLSNWNFNF